MLIQEYKKSWLDDFNALKKILYEGLSPLTIRIEHIGSTSIPNLAAKSIIDIDLVYDENVEFDVLKMKLVQLGYFHNGNQGIPNREVFKRRKTAVSYPILDALVHHLYVCPSDSEELRKHILFRNYLLANDEARIQYQNLKYAIAEEANQDRKKYAQLKEIRARDFIKTIIDGVI